MVLDAVGRKPHGVFAIQVLRAAAAISVVIAHIEDDLTEALRPGGSPVKAAQDGQVVPLASVTSGANFLGWLDPSALGTPAAAPVALPAPAASG